MKRRLLISFVVIALRFGNLTAQTAPTASSNAQDKAGQPLKQLNEKLPKWVQLNGSYRVRVEEQQGIGFENVSDSHILGQFQLGMRLQPSTWLSLFGETQDSRIYLDGPVPKLPPYQNTWDLHQAWSEIGDIDRYHFRVRVGRQELNFGDQRLVGIAPWLNSPRVFDAIETAISLAGWRTDIFASSVVNSVDGQLDHHKQGNPFYGIYGSLSTLVPKATLEPYFLWRLSPLGYGPSYASGLKGKLDEKTVGVRFVGELPGSFDYSLEMAHQMGSLGDANIRAWAGHWCAGHRFGSKIKPRILAELNYASGTANPGGTKISTFDQLYPGAHDKLGLTDQVGWRNILDLRTGGEFRPSSKLTIAAIYHDLWLADSRDGLYAATGAVVAKSLSGVAGTHVGEEIDIQGFYKYNTTLQLGAGFGHLSPGEFLKNTTPGKPYDYPFFVVTYTF